MEVDVSEECGVLCCNQMGYVLANEHLVSGFDPKKYVEI